MKKSLSMICIVVVLHTAASSGWNENNGGIILPTFRPPPIWPGIKTRTVRESGNEPLWLYQGDDFSRAPTSADHPVLPSIIDDVKLDPNRRYARSISGPSSPEHHGRFVRSFDSRRSKHHGGGHYTSSGSRDIGSTHPGYNRRNA